MQSDLGPIFREVSHFPVLTAEEEQKLAKIKGARLEKQLYEGNISLEEYERTHQESQSARDRLIKCNMRLVISFARKFSRQRNSDIHDLINEGMIGLIHAAETFKPGQSKFSSYAAYHINQRLIRSLDQSLVRLPFRVSDAIYCFQKDLQGMGSGRTIEEIASITNRSVKTVTTLQKSLKIRTRTNLFQKNEDDRNPLNEIVDQNTMARPGIDAHYVVEQLNQLTPREQLILKQYYGLNGNEPHTLKQIGERIGLTKERIRQIRDNALEKMQDFLEASGV